MLMPKEIDFCGYNEKALHVLKGIKFLTEEFDSNENFIESLKLDLNLIKTMIKFLKDLKKINESTILGISMYKDYKNKVS